ncbi:hypothetical protein NP493_607g01038 [Ridgeia piscesae]|uniref:Uncharacterized protein n=1 Tax=Ridgeia piscesae TaxID=27915 RepID=A0AAD9KTS2_RIDPI|nr:hypothetical protein NP493_607g01038 [Ridgeia piscesae]
MASNLSSILCDTLQQNYHLATFSFAFELKKKNCKSLALFKIVTSVTLIVMCKINCLDLSKFAKKVKFLAYMDYFCAILIMYKHKCLQSHLTFAMAELALSEDKHTDCIGTYPNIKCHFETWTYI